ncbi:hypothetical protein [Thermosulfurimonas sp. F29]|uniref:hypothetical protein n=1 Tax=Thermosulfurimonas sp. F29 TaxID=2867247 RepID=UPI001C82B18A|nr:hypothetical protein [Thermosulfurimonas sp. F29]MBX6423409.1 hypothetical protein [Thermosulfurimonas sp. F29]
MRKTKKFVVVGGVLAVLAVLVLAGAVVWKVVFRRPGIVSRRPTAVRSVSKRVAGKVAGNRVVRGGAAARRGERSTGKRAVERRAEPGKQAEGLAAKLKPIEPTQAAQPEKAKKAVAEENKEESEKSVGLFLALVGKKEKAKGKAEEKAVGNPEEAARRLLLEEFERARWIAAEAVPGDGSAAKSYRDWLEEEGRWRRLARTLANRRRVIEEEVKALRSLADLYGAVRRIETEEKTLLGVKRRQVEEPGARFFGPEAGSADSGISLAPLPTPENLSSEQKPSEASPPRKASEIVSIEPVGKSPEVNASEDHVLRLVGVVGDAVVFETAGGKRTVYRVGDVVRDRVRLVRVEGGGVVVRWIRGGWKHSVGEEEHLSVGAVLDTEG